MYSRSTQRAHVVVGLPSAFCRPADGLPSGDCRATVGRPSGIGLVERGAGDKYLTKTLTKTEKG